MRLGSKMAMHLFEAAEAIGIAREQLTTPLGLDPDQLAAPRGEIEWDTLVALLDRLSIVLDGDVERMRVIGRKMTRAPSFEFLQRIARSVFSLQSLYEVGERWVAPASVPHLRLQTTFPSEDRMLFRCSIPEPHAPSLPYLYIFEGLLLELPSMLGLAPATLVSSRVTPRELELVLDLPPSRSLLARVRRAVRAAFHMGEALDLMAAQRREVEEGLEAVQLATSELQSLFDRVPDLVIIQRDGLILWSNRAVVQTLGFGHSDELVGRAVLDVVDPPARAQAESRMRIDTDGEELPDLFESRLVTRDGAVVLVEVSPAQNVTFGGRPARLIVGRDVTEHKRLQQQLLTADRLASIGMLAAGVAHEVNNPLAYVLNNVEMAIKDLAPLGEQTRHSREALAVALEGVDRIRTIVRDLLALSRVDDIALGPVDVRAVIESTLALAAQKIAERAELECEYRPVPLARGTPARLGQVVLNLLANALEAMPVATRSHNRLRVAVLPSATGGAVVEVSDNGVGIAPEHVARIFDPFFTTKSFGSGTGLGLAISQRLVAEIGGELSFESLPKRGSTFRVTLVPAESDELVLTPAAVRP
jgi:PAS domain S-box-containing protein